MDSTADSLQPADRRTGPARTASAAAASAGELPPSPPFCILFERSLHPSEFLKVSNDRQVKPSKTQERGTSLAPLLSWTPFSVYKR